MKKILMIVSLFLLIGCQGENTKVDSTIENTGEIEVVKTEIPLMGNTIDDFTYDNWKVESSQSFDFDNDGVNDMIGILKNESTDLFEPNILLILKGVEDGFELNFSSKIYLSKGGALGEANYVIEAKEDKFYLLGSGGRAWQWSSEDIFEYDGEWHLIASSGRTWNIGYDESVNISETYKDYITKKAVFYINDRDYEYLTAESHDDDYKLVFEMPLDKPPTLKAFIESRRDAMWHLERFKLDRIVYSETIELTPDQLKEMADNPDILNYIDDVNEFSIYLTYRFEDKELLLIYDRANKETVILAESMIESFNDGFGSADMHQGYVYYTIHHSPTHEAFYRCDMNGMNHTLIYEEKANSEEELLFIHPTFWNDKIMMYVSKGGINIYYSMNLDGSDVKYIGEVNGMTY